MKVQLNQRALQQVRRLPKVKRELGSRADAIAVASGKEKGYVATTGEGKSRSRAAVIAAGRWSQRDNAKYNTILKNVGAGRR